MKDTMLMKKDKLEDYGEMLVPEDIQKIVKIGRNEVYKKLKSGEIRSHFIAGKYRIPKKYLLEFIYPDEQNGQDDHDKHDDQKGA